MNKHIKVLIVEDSKDDMLLLLRELKKGGYKPTHKRVETATAMKKALKEHWDVILSDYKMPKFSAPDALKVLQASKLDIPFIIVSGSIGEDAAVDTLKDGAHDFITKMNLSRLVPAIEREIQDWKIRQAKKLAELSLQESEHRYKHLFQNHPSPMWVYDIATLKFLDVNDAAIDKYGYTREEFLSMTLFDIRPKKDYARLKENLAKPRPALQHSGEWTHLLKNGEIIFVEISSYLFEDNGKKLSLVVVNDITERKRAEESLKKSELQYQTLAKISPVGIFRTDSTGYTTYVNPRWCQISGLSADEALGDGWLKAVHPDDRKKLSVGWKKSTHTRKGSAAEYRFIRPDGTIAWVMGQAVPEKNLENKIVGYVGTITDITDRKYVEEALEESEENFRNLVENINDVFYVSDGQGKLLYCSPNFFTSTGFSLEEILGKTYLRLIAPADRRKVVEHYLEETKNGVLDTKLEFRVLRKNGTTLWVEQNTRIVRDNNGKVVQYRNVVRDIGERKRAELASKQTEEALRASELKFRSVVEEAVEIVFTVDNRGYFTYVNPAGLKLVGYSLDELKKLKYIDLVVPEYKQIVTRNYLRQYKERSTLTTTEYPARTKSGEVKWFNQNARLIIENNEVQGFYIIARDVTERHNAEEALKKSEERYRSLFERMMDGVYRSTHEGKFVEVNPAMVQMFGFSSKEEMLNVDIKKELYFAPSERDSLFLDTGQERTEIFRMRCKDGSEMWVEDHGRYVHDEKGNVIFHEGILRDVTKRLIAEDTLKKSEEKYRDIFAWSPVGIYQSSIDGKILTANQSLADILGYDGAEDLLNRKFADDIYFNEQERQKLIKESDKEKGAITNLEVLWKKKDGAPIWVSLVSHTIRDTSGKTIYYEGFVIDIDKRKRVEKELRKKEDRMRLLVEGTPYLFFYTQDIQGRITYVSPSVEKITGHPADDWYNQTHWFVTDNKINEYAKERTHAHLRGEITEGSILLEVEHADKHPVLLEVYESPMILDGKVVGTQGIAHDITERKRSEEAMLKLTKAVESSGEVIFMTDPNGIFTYVNPEFTKLYGYEADVVIGKSTPRILKSGVMKNEEYDVFWQTLLQKKVLKREMINKSKDGKLINVELAVNPVTDEKKNIIGFLAIQKDITERKRAEEALRQSEKQYRDFFENDITGDYISTIDARILVCNPAFTQIMGYNSVEELMNINTVALYESKEKREGFLDLLREKKKLELHEMELQRRDGKKIKIIENVIGEFNEQGELIRIKGYMFDITERKEAEEALKLQTTYFSQLFENSPSGIAFLDTNDCVMNVNKSFENLFQYSLEEIKGKSLTNLIVPEELVKESLSFSTKAMQGELVRLPSIRKRRDGARLDIIITGYPIMIEGKCVGIYAIYADVSDIKKLEEQVRQTQKLESIGTLAGGIAHDFNNILGIILGYTSLLGRGYDNPEKVKQSVEAISKAVQRGAGLVKQILTFARKTDIVFGAVNVNETVAELVKMLHETFPKTITLSQQLHHNLPPIIADHNQIHQALLNLSVNARDAILSTTTNGHGGSITFITKIILGTELRKKNPEAMDEAYACLSVKDTGSGMDEVTLKRIFEPFFTTKDIGRGTGLGLAVVYGVVKSHRGYIDVESALGVGTTFNLYFPLEVQEIEIIKTGIEEKEEIKGGTETILVVEDEEVLQELVKTMLEMGGYRVLTANDGEEGIEIYRKNKEEISIVLTDLGLPKLGGFEAFLKMKEINPNVKAIIASGYFDPDQKVDMLKADIKDFVQKPYRPNEVLKILREVLDR
jgi:PAS domain S-box-containing protein